MGFPVISTFTIYGSVLVGNIEYKIIPSTKHFIWAIVVGVDNISWYFTAVIVQGIYLFIYYCISYRGSLF